MAIRIYLVKTGSGARLIRASSRIAARNHVARESITSEVASQDQIVDMIEAGIKVETAMIEAADAVDAAREAAGALTT